MHLESDKAQLNPSFLDLSCTCSFTIPRGFSRPLGRGVKVMSGRRKE